VVAHRIELDLVSEAAVVAEESVPVEHSEERLERSLRITDRDPSCPRSVRLGRSVRARRPRSLERLRGAREISRELGGDGDAVHTFPYRS
jgi:hypothetical protein